MPMRSAAEFDPWSAERRLAWQNRVAAWRAAPAEPIFHALSAVALLGLVAWAGASVLDLHAELLSRWFVERWQWLLPLLFVALLVAQQRALSARLGRRERGWFALQPIASRVRLRDARRHASRMAATQAVALLLAAAAIELPLVHALGVAGCALAAGAATWAAPRPWLPAGAPRAPARDTPFTARGAGRMWRWQAIEIGSLLGPRPSALMLLVLLLVPTGTPLGAALATALGLLLLSASLAAWQRSLAVLFAAEQWCAGQPIPPRRLLAHWARLPALQLLAMAAVAGLLVRVLGAGQLAWAVAAGVGMLGVLQMACVAAGRAHRRRAALLFAIHLALLVALAQAMAPAVLLLWVAQLAWLTRRSLRWSGR